MTFSITTHDASGVVVVAVHGEFDVATAPQVRGKLAELIDAGHDHLVVDLGAVDLLDSTGLGTLVGGLKRARQHDGSLVVVCPRDRIRRLFELTGLTKIFVMSESVEDALATGLADRTPSVLPPSARAAPSRG